MEMDATASDKKDGRDLRRVLTTIPATSIIVAGVIGTGVFIKAKVMIVNVQTPGMVLLVYLLAGLLTLGGSLVYAELSTMIPRTGGQFNYIGAAFGRRLAFLGSWTAFCARLSGTAAIAILTVVFLNDLLGGTLSPMALKFLPILFIGIVTLLNLSSVRSMGWFATAMTLVKIVLILLYFNSLIGSLAIKPKDRTFNAAAKFNGPELFPTRKFEFFKANIIPPKSFFEQLIK